MIKRYCYQCDTCGDMEVVHEMEGGELVFFEDIKLAISRLEEFHFPAGGDSQPKLHNQAVKELKALLG